MQLRLAQSRIRQRSGRRRGTGHERERRARAVAPELRDLARGLHPRSRTRAGNRSRVARLALHRADRGHLRHRRRGSPARRASRSSSSPARRWNVGQVRERDRRPVRAGERDRRRHRDRRRRRRRSGRRRGSGLRGLRSRRGLDGLLLVTSPRGAGTSVPAEALVSVPTVMLKRVRRSSARSDVVGYVSSCCGVMGQLAATEMDEL